MEEARQTAQTALTVCERLRKELARIDLECDQGAVRFTVSIGLAMFKEEDDTLDTILERADAALYRAKENGRNRIEKSQ